MSPLALEDGMLVRRVQEGDTSAFGRLVTKYQDRVTNLCWRMCGSMEDARDLAQETFVHALQKIGMYRFEASFYTWLFRIAVNESLSHRRRSRRVTLSLHDGDGAWAGDRPGSRPLGRQTNEADEPLAAMVARELQEQVEAGLERLDDDQRSIIVLRDVEGLDYQEIAAVLDLSVGTVKSRLHRARMALREIVMHGPTAGKAKTSGKSRMA